MTETLAAPAEELTKAEAAALEELVFRMTPGPKSARDIAAHLRRTTSLVYLTETRALRKLRKLMAKNHD